MKNTFYAALIISREPINLDSVVIDQEEPRVLRHLIKREFNLESDAQGGWVVSMPIDDEQDHQGLIIRATGRCVSETIAGWFTKLVSTMWYKPIYHKD